MFQLDQWELGKGLEEMVLHWRRGQEADSITPGPFSPPGMQSCFANGEARQALSEAVGPSFIFSLRVAAGPSYRQEEEGGEERSPLTPFIVHATFSTVVYIIGRP